MQRAQLFGASAELPNTALIIGALSRRRSLTATDGAIGSRRNRRTQQVRRVPNVAEAALHIHELRS
jgi:hypothetical protein